MRHTTLHRRGGFTLVEILIAAALTMLIMTILALSFQTAMDSLSHLRAAGDLQDRLRTAGEKIKQDLVAPHFEDEAIAHGMVSNVRFDKNPAAIPAAGYFRIDQGGPAAQENPVNAATRPQDYSTFATNHMMQFTVKLPGTSRQSVFTAPRVGCSSGQQCLDGTHDNLIRDTGTYGSRWGVVSWFLTASPERTKGPNQSPLFTLHRRVRLLAEVPNGHIDGAATNPFYVADGATGLVRTARDVATTVRQPYAELGDGSVIVLANVLSFEIKAEYSGVGVSSGGVNTVFPRPAGAPLAPLTGSDLTNPANGFNFDFPFDDLPRHATTPASPRHFDTGEVGGTGSGQSYRVKSLQIKLRVYDPKTMNTRQVTLVQEM